MDTPSIPHESNRVEPPLWSIGLAVVLILGAPLVLYSLAPTGPLRKGDTVFSDGQQHVQFSNPTADLPRQPVDSCLLDPNTPLIIIQEPSVRPDGPLVAEVQGSLANEWPFCPVHAEVVLQTGQLFQKPALFTAVKRLLARVWGR